MRWPTLAALGFAFILLGYGTVAVFLVLDRDSHSASDTLRPFVITMLPVWAVFVWAGVSLLRRHR
jgi:hypothetical protein